MTEAAPTRIGGRIPHYVRIKSAILDRYVEGRPADYPLPPERSLAEDFGVSRATLRRAIDVLESDGLVYRIQGGGTFCVGPGVAKSLKLTSFSEDIRAHGRVPGSTVLSAEVTAAGEETGRRLRISPSAPIARIYRIRLANTEPMCLEVSALPADLVPGITEANLTGSLYELLDQTYGLRPHWAEQTVSATVLDPDDAALLQVAPFSPALKASRVSFDARSRPIEFAVTIYRADQYSLRYAVRRD